MSSRDCLRRMREPPLSLDGSLLANVLATLSQPLHSEHNALQEARFGAKGSRQSSLSAVSLRNSIGPPCSEARNTSRKAPWHSYPSSLNHDPSRRISFPHTQKKTNQQAAHLNQPLASRRKAMSGKAVVTSRHLQDNKRKSCRKSLKFRGSNKRMLIEFVSL